MAGSCALPGQHWAAHFDYQGVTRDQGSDCCLRSGRRTGNNTSALPAILVTTNSAYKQGRAREKHGTHLSAKPAAANSPSAHPHMVPTAGPDSLQLRFMCVAAATKPRRGQAGNILQLSTTVNGPCIILQWAVHCSVPPGRGDDVKPLPGTSFNTVPTNASAGDMHTGCTLRSAAESGRPKLSSCRDIETSNQ